MGLLNRADISFPYTIEVPCKYNYANTFTIYDRAGLNKLINDFFTLMDVVEEAGMFDSGVGGKNARNALVDIGVWSEGMRDEPTV